MIQWDEELQLGHKALDDHHKRMLKAANLLYAAQRAAAKEEVLTHLRELISASAEHFVFEEELMAQINYPNAAIHTEHHGEILAQLERFFERALANNFRDAEDVLAFLTGWLSSHLMTFDRDFVDFMGRP